jgi:general L-amino acid transport system substrate-binding protein
MKKLLSILAVSVFAFTANAGTLDDVKNRGILKCGVTTGLAGFAAPDDSGEWAGLDADMCRAVAVAVFGDPSKVEFITTTGKSRFPALNNNEIDMLARNTTWTLSRDVNLSFEFVGVNFYDGQGFMIPSSLGVSSATELEGASVCIQTGTTTELNLADYFEENGMSYEALPIETNDEGKENLFAGRCDVYTTDASGLASTRAAAADPSKWVVLPEIISKEPLGPLVRHGDHQWGDVVRWSLNAMIIAEELGITSENAAELKASSPNKEVLRLLGAESGYGDMLELSDDWAYNIITMIGNYSESYEANVGPDTPLQIARGLNALWTDGGILYAPPFR